MARDILKARFATKGLDLRDDDCLYRNDKLIATDVHVVEDGHDCIAFEFDLVAEDIEFGKPTISPTLH